MELPRKRSTLPEEKLYEIAAWNSTLRTLGKLCADPYIYIESQNVPEIVQNLAQAAFKDPSEVITVAKTVADNSWRKGNPPHYRDLVYMGILVPNRDYFSRGERPYLLSKGFSQMHELYYGSRVLPGKATYADVERFESDIDDLAAFHQKKLSRAIIDNCDLIDRIQAIQHDNIHYLGEWEHQRNLGNSDH